MTRGRPDDTEYAPFYSGYVALVQEDDPVPVLEVQPAELRLLASRISADRETFRYAPDRWSVRQTFGHMIDTERVMGYRAFCIGRGEEKPLPGFDQNDYVASASADQRAVVDLVDEFAAVRASNLWTIRQWTPGGWSRTGNANGKPVSARALTFIMAGHVRHHVDILRDRYGVGG